MQVSKKVKSNNANEKHCVIPDISTDNLNIKQMFDSVDRNGKFAFVINRDDFDEKIFIEQMLNISTQTWKEIKLSTHNKKNHTCHHFLDFDGMSKEAKQRVCLMVPEEDVEYIFSMRMNSLCRIIGIRKKDVFNVKWFDVNHEFYPTDD